MPIGARKNQLYGLALPLLGLRSPYRNVQKNGDASADLSDPLCKVLRQNHVIGGCIQRMEGGSLAENYTFGQACLSPASDVTPDTYFRTASIAKMACALLVMRLQTLNRLDVNEDISEFWGEPIRNPFFPDTPIPLAALLSHTSGIVDSPLYYASIQNPTSVTELLNDAQSYSVHRPFERFRYSNFAAGLIGCLLEKRFGESLEALAQKELFKPLGASATFDLSTLASTPPACSYRVLPPSASPAFDTTARLNVAFSLSDANPQAHYLLASGGLFITVEGLARLALPLMNGGLVNGQPFLAPDSIEQMKTARTEWPEKEVRMRHGLGLLSLDDPAVFPRRLFGHQGFAYGAVNCVFFDEQGNGFASLNSGASEQRVGHLSCLNRDLIHVILGGNANG